MTSESSDRTPRVLFVCTRFGGRAMLAAAMAEKKAGDCMDIMAAGFERAQVGQRLSVCGKEVGLDIEPHPDGIPTVFDLKTAGENFDRVVMMCDPDGNESCEVFEKHIKALFKSVVDNRLWPISDLAQLPKEEAPWLEGARLIRDDISRHVDEFLAEV